MSRVVHSSAQQQLGKHPARLRRAQHVAGPGRVIVAIAPDAAGRRCRINRRRSAKCRPAALAAASRSPGRQPRPAAAASGMQRQRRPAGSAASIVGQRVAPTGSASASRRAAAGASPVRSQSRQRQALGHRRLAARIGGRAATGGGEDMAGWRAHGRSCAPQVGGQCAPHRPRPRRGRCRSRRRCGGRDRHSRPASRPRSAQPRHPGGEAEAGDTDAEAQFQHRWPGCAGTAAASSTGSDAGAIAGLRLHRCVSRPPRKASCVSSHQPCARSPSRSRCLPGSAAPMNMSRSRTISRRGRIAQRAVEHAHVDVERKGVYTLAVQKGGGEGDDRRVGGSQKLFHGQGLTARHGRLSRRMTGDGPGRGATRRRRMRWRRSGGRDGGGERADPRADGVGTCAAHPRGHRASGRGRRQAAAADADAGGGAALRLRRRHPHPSGGDGGIHPHRDAAA